MTMLYVRLGDLFIYKISLELCDMGWQIYESLNWKQQKIIGDQFITSVDSVAANIAEGYGRYHYLDKIKFYYNARGSLTEAKHWIFLLCKRNIISKETFDTFLTRTEQVHFELNKYIKTTYSAKYNETEK